MHRIGDSFVRPTLPTIACALATWEALNLRCPVLGALVKIGVPGGARKVTVDAKCAICGEIVLGAGPTAFPASG